jgi:hypothetical protein
MTRQLRRSRDRAARKRRQVTKLVREGTGHLSDQDKREMRLGGRPERIERHIMERELKTEIVDAVIVNAVAVIDTPVPEAIAAE